MKKKLSLFLTLVMALGSANIVSAKEFTDTTNSWASEAIDRWSDSEVVGGYEDGSFKPQNNITRAEFLSMLDKLMQYQTIAENTTTDMTGSEWYAESVLKNIAAGNVENTTGDVNASEKVTRSEVAVTLCKALDIQPVEGNTTFADDSSISAESKGYVKALQEKGFISGRSNNTFDGDAYITRAEVVSMFDKVIQAMYTEAGTYTENVDGNVVINTEDVVLQNTVISGDLIVAAGVGEGDLTLENVTVEGDVIVEGGGSHSVKFTKGSKAKRVKMQKNSKETVRLYVDKDSAVSTVVTDSTAPVLVEGEGTIESVIVDGNNTVTIAENTEVGTLEVVDGATVVNNGEIGEVVIVEDAGETVIEGTGSIKVVNCRNDKATFRNNIEKLIIHNPNAQITISDLVKAILDSFGRDFSDKVHHEKSDNKDKDKDKDKNKYDDDDDDDNDGRAPKIVNVKVAYTSSSAVTVRFNSNERGTVDYEFLVNGEVDSKNSLYDQPLKTGLNVITLGNLSSTVNYTLKITATDADGNSSVRTIEISGKNAFKLSVDYLGRETNTAYVRVVAKENAEIYYFAEKKTSDSAVTVVNTSGSAVNVAPEYVVANGDVVKLSSSTNYAVLPIEVEEGVEYTVYVVVNSGDTISSVYAVDVEAYSNDTTAPELVEFNITSVYSNSVSYKYSFSEMSRIYTIITTDAGKEAITETVLADPNAIKDYATTNQSTSDVRVAVNSAIQSSNTSRSGFASDTNYTIYMVAEDYAGNMSEVYINEFKTLVK